MGALLPFMGMVLRILAQVSNMVVCKAAMSGGLNQYVLILYSNALATLIFLSCSFLFYRTERPSITLSILWRIFLLALIGTASQICGFVGIKYSSPALGAAMLNLVPAFTFILSIIFRMEKLEWRSNSSRAKALGTLVSIIGAFLVTVYKGPPILMKPSLNNAPVHQLISSSQLNWILGGVFLAAEALTGSAWYVAQAFLLEEFPALFIVMFYQAFFGLILNGAYSLAMVKDPSAWKLKLDMGLLAVFYSAIVGIAFSNILVAWCLLRMGPLYVTMFKPLGIIFAVAMGIIFLRDVLCLGSLIGSIIIVIGFYSVMWGKAKEEKISKEDEVATFNSSSEKVPLLENKAEDVMNSA